MTSLAISAALFGAELLLQMVHFCLHRCVVISGSSQSILAVISVSPVSCEHFLCHLSDGFFSPSSLWFPLRSSSPYLPCHRCRLLFRNWCTGGMRSHSPEILCNLRASTHAWRALRPNTYFCGSRCWNKHLPCIRGFPRTHRMPL